MLQHLYRQLNAAVDASTLLLALCTFLAVFLSYKLFLKPLYFSPLRVMPSAKFIPIVGQIWDINRQQAIVSDLRRARKLGPISRYFVTFGEERVMIADPDAMKHILVTNHANYVRPYLLRSAFAALAEKGLLAVSGTEHAMQRKILNPAFKRENLKGMVKTFQQWTEVVVQYWNDKLEGTTTSDGFAELPVQDDIGRLTLDIIGECAFSYEFNSIREPDRLVNQSVTRLLQDSGASWITVVTAGSVFVATKEFLKLRGLCERIVDDVIAERKQLQENPEQADDDAPNDLLSLVMMARDRDTGEGLPEEVIRHEVMTFMVAGHETTSAGLAWLLLELSRHPDIQDRLRSEVRDVLPSDDTPITWDLLDQIPYLMWVVKETLRLHPPAPQTFRQALKDDRVGQYPIPAGTIVKMSPAVIHRLSEYWEDPDTFKPERFAGDANNRNPYTFLPFIAGPRTCIGSKFALAEMRAVTAVLVQHFQFHPVPGVECKNKHGITMRPEPDLCLRVSKAPA
ncbi:cytochrome P450 4F3-like [Branchiostoma floridae]|uniref:Cytochrome P450 4F3-like n=1 Tax=Branchiostoma floridae TaxID=7739 RepID=C3ZCL1_BRAFL|nr:cytochrome P450 4F3-like [Branchiostoma floridae]|eukprot:XP_002593704.1 hypothetical protein BRAFLDRAFT_117251 [Branchiostoma floridae]